MHCSSCSGGVCSGKDSDVEQPSSQRPDVLTLSFAVTYWDYLGWKDSFGKPEFTDRQRVYEPALGERGPYTPQMVVNGRTTAVGNNLSEVDGLIQGTTPNGGPTISLGQDNVDIGTGTGPEASADVWLVRYDPHTLQVDIIRGENGGRTLAHRNIVKELTRLGDWTGAATRFTLPPGSDSGLQIAILVQGKHGGPILAALKA